MYIDYSKGTDQYEFRKLNILIMAVIIVFSFVALELR